MSLTDGLILHFVPEGTSPTNGKIAFKGEGGGTIEVNNQNVNLVQASLFGLSLNFSGPTSYLELNHPAMHGLEDFTLGGWFKFNTQSAWVRLIGKGRYGAGDESIGLWANPSTNAWWISQQGTIPEGRINRTAKEIVPDAWYHITAVRQQGTLTLYYNTEVLGTVNGINGAPNDPRPLRLGYSEEHGGFTGEMAHIRMYNRALTANEIYQMIIATGVATLAPAVTTGSFVPLNDLPGSAFKRSHPVDFALFDQNNHYALYIDDSNALGQPMTFEVHNSSDRAIQFHNEEGKTASATNYHFELQFRPGVLSANTLNRLRDPQRKSEVMADSTNWDIFVSTESGPAEHVSLYLLHKGEPTWQPNTRRSLRFVGINADAAGGAAGTQVSLLTNKLTFVESNASLSGRRTHHMSIINHRGEKSIPLHVGFNGSNQVLNANGAESSLSLQIVNNLRLAQTHADIPTISLTAAKAGQKGTHFIIEFDVQQEGEDKPWALGRASELRSLTITANFMRRGQGMPNPNAEFQVSPNTQSISPQWTITPVNDMVLHPGDTIHVQLKGIVTSLPTGPTHLYVHYHNVRAYQDGQFVLPVMKSPLLFAGSNVGIGTATPTQRLDVAERIRTHTHPPANTLALYVTGECQPASGLAEFRHNNGTQGIGIGYNTIYATGGNPAQDLNLAARGSGKVRILGSAAISQNAGLVLQVEPASGKAVHIGRSAHNGLEFDFGAGSAINSTANISLNIDSNNTETNQRYIDFRANGQGFSGGTSLMRIKETGAVSIGSAAYAAPNNYVAGGALTIGNINQNYGGGTNWNGSTAGLLLECSTHTEIAVHDSHTRIASLLYYEGDATNRITMGRDMGWGKTDVYIAGNLSIEGGLSKKFRRWWSMGIQDDRDWGNTRIGLITNANWSNSDARLKHEIEPINQALQKISQLNGVTYKWNSGGLQYLTRDIDTQIFAGPEASEEENQKAREEARKEACELLAGNEVGLLAQDVEQVLPELVRTGEDGYKSIRYDLLSALLVEAVKELSRQLDEVKSDKETN